MVDQNVCQAWGLVRQNPFFEIVHNAIETSVAWASLTQIERGEGVDE